MRKLVLLLAFVLAISACGGGSGDSAETTAAPQSSTAGEDTLAPTETPETTGDTTSGSEDVAEPGEQAPSFDGPPAPDFDLALADGSNFSLSAEQKPVYIVFWAEW